MRIAWLRGLHADLMVTEPGLAGAVSVTMGFAALRVSYLDPLLGRE